jgi:hypothetical protein
LFVVLAWQSHPNSLPSQKNVRDLLGHPMRQGSSTDTRLPRTNGGKWPKKSGGGSHQVIVVAGFGAQ